MDFKTWHEEVADMPTRGADGEWYDAETGLPFRPTQPSRTLRSELEREAARWTLAALRERCEKIVAGQDTTSRRFRGIYADVVLDKAAASAEAGRFLLSNRKTTKIEFLSHASENVVVTREIAAEKTRVYGANGKVTAPHI